ncbi:CDP-diacylglycerol--glycerol-3-phosphate 3-phosphatidyltransferase [Calycomorphotria hydatis]|uniref:CDP-diacylglycerol--glycerol-3-phosphate 3-phosphatidyltransferase n=1 Tax=Calycomorphotria hydatis TaxID=2528027 RepID=A0A517T7T2_9PLAN|nr:CDP-diacylglycerol--glycerol-3-phosphate 3-phosphatidyltransferase [Calycomorphotria hydatis]QDT64429.1 CDP-diacylglycerol--glycerol-3-phosphate 3-phosphatidyltransferase [Calycomorphotria hydatis]
MSESPDQAAAPKTNPNSWNLPNLITISRLIASFVLFVLMSVTNAWLVCTVLFVVAVITDAIDGYLARKWNQITVLGRILDPFVDKIIVCGSFIFLLAVNIDPDKNSGVTAWMVIIVIGREMFVTGLRSFLEKEGLDFSADVIGKVKMVLQSIAVAVSMTSLSPVFADVAGYILARDLLLWSTAAFTAYSGIAYTARAVKLFRERTADS